MSFDIYGMGTAVPEYTMTTEDAVSLSTDIICRDKRETRLLTAMLRRSRVAKRHTCVPHTIAYNWFGEDDEPGSSSGPTTKERMAMYAEHAGPLSVRSAEIALDAAKVRPQEVSNLVTVSCNGFEAPGLDITLIEKLGLPRTTGRVNVGFMGCHGAINGLRASLGMAQSGADGVTLLCATELCSLHYAFRWDDDRILGNALFADGSASIVGGQGREQDAICSVKKTGSCIVPESKKAIMWNVGDYGFEMALSSEVPELILQHLKPWLVRWLASNDLSLEQVSGWAVHPGGPKILDAVEEALGLDDDALRYSREVLNEMGNMSSPTVLFILQRMLADQLRGPCVALGFGPGLAIEAAILEPTKA